MGKAHKLNMSIVQEFREAVNGNEDWQEEVKNFGFDDDIVSYASGKGYEFTNEEYSEYVEENSSGELSEFEAELVSGGWTVSVRDEDYAYSQRIQYCPRYSSS